MADNSRRTDKMRFKYHSDHNNDDEKSAVMRPRIEIAMRKSSDPVNASTNPEFRTFGLVDSGADISFIPRNIADILHLELSDATIKTTKSASGEFDTYRTTMHLEIIYKKYRVSVGTVNVAVPQKDKITTDLERYILIGRDGLFDKYKITFNEASKTIDLTRIARP